MIGQWAMASGGGMILRPPLQKNIGTLTSNWGSESVPRSAGEGVRVENEYQDDEF